MVVSRILVTGANGFVGRAACESLLNRGHHVTGLVRRAGGCVHGVVEWVDDRADFVGLDDNAFRSGEVIDCVVHLAARVHVMRDGVRDPQAAFDATNVTGTLRIARAARQLGARRFVFVSSIKAVAERDGGVPLTEDAEPRPEDAYGHSKWKAEEALRQLGRASGMEIVIIRPPLVYGPGVRANFLSLMRVVARGVPLPLGMISARRSLLYVGNLADVLTCCVDDPRAANCTFHVADDDAPTVTDLLKVIGEQLNKPARLFPVPTRALYLLGRVMGRTPQIERLTGSLRVDASLIRRTLDWRPPFSTREGLCATARWYRTTCSPE